MEIDHELKRKTEIYLNHGTDDSILRPDNVKVTYSFFDKHKYNYEYVEIAEKGHDFGYETDYMAIRKYLNKYTQRGKIEKEWEN